MRHPIDHALAHFNGDWDELTYALNKVLKREGKPLISRQAVQAWRANGVPASRVPTLEKATNGALTREEIRPDLYR